MFLFILIIIHLQSYGRGNNGLQCTNLLLESKQKRFYTVDVDTLKKDCTVHSMTKENQYSKSDCVYHVSYGFTMTELWVDKGCRADFRICFATTEDNSFKHTSLNTDLETTRARITTTDPPVTSQLLQTATFDDINCCQCQSPNKVDFNDVITAITVDRRNTNSYLRTKTSARQDDRTSSKVIGWFGIIVCSIPFILSIFIDALNLVIHLK